MTKRINTEKAPAAIGPYSQGVAAGNFLFVSGQLPIDPKTGSIDADNVADQARQSLTNLSQILEAAGTSMDKVVKTTVFLQSMGDFAAMNAVYAEFFTEGQYPARSAVEVGALPRGALVESEALLDALKNAAKRGVDVRLVLPGIPDKKLVFRLSRSYYLPLLQAGVRIYEYTPGFLHAKCWVSDDRAAVVGSINMDYRSLFLHFECGVLLQHNSQVAALRDDVRATLPQCREIHISDCRTSIPGTLLDSVLRLLSPLM